MIRAIVLAAGRSRRMGTQKLLLPWAGSTVIGRIVDELLAARLSGVDVVVGRDADRIEAALSGRDVELVVNPDEEADMLASVRCGLRSLPADCEAAVVALGDQPMITAALVSELVEAFRASDKSVALPVFQGRRGHPIILATSHRDEVLSSHGGVGLRGLVRAHDDDVLEVAVRGDSVLLDIDRPEDYRRAVERIGDPGK